MRLHISTFRLLSHVFYVSFCIAFCLTSSYLRLTYRFGCDFFFLRDCSMYFRLGVILGMVSY